MACCRQHGSDGVLIQESRAYLVAQFGARLLARLCRTLRAGFHHGVIDIGGGQNASRLGEHGRRDATMVARAIQAFMMLCCQRTHRS